MGFGPLGKQLQTHPPYLQRLRQHPAQYSSLHSGPTAHSLIYAGSKDGQVKVCYTKNDKIEILGGILTHTQSVNALTSLYENPYGLVTASQDKTIKLWQPTRDTLENIARENYF